MSVTHAMLGNAALVAVLSVIALVVGSVVRSPAVRHVVWVLILLKLLSPPLFLVPLAVLPASWGEPLPGPTPLEPLSLAWHVLLPTTTTADAQEALPQTVLPDVSTRGDGLLHAGGSGGLLAMWAVGSVGWFVYQGRRILRFRSRFSRAGDADAEVADATRRLAAALGIASSPPVKLAPGIGSPMLWGWLGGTVILFPRELLGRLGPEARDTLLAHELAHYMRRDHWVRVLEFVTTGLYWWHPAVWLARAGIESAEEECCDAWVVAGLSASPRRYAEALLATVDFGAELRRPRLPPGACAANRRARLLHRRLVGILHARPPRRYRGGIFLRVAVVLLLVVQPVLRACVPEEVEAVSVPALVEPLRPGQTSTPPAEKPNVPPAWAVATSPDGEVTALARDREVVLRRSDGVEKTLGPGKPLALAFAPGARRIATAGPGYLIRTWDYHGGLVAEASTPAAARAIAYTPDGSRLLVLDSAGGISVRESDTLAPVAGWMVDGPANSIACAPDGGTVAVAFGSWLDEATGWVEFWSIADCRHIATYRASAPVGATRFALDGQTLVIGGWSGYLTWRSLPGGEVLAVRHMPKSLVAAAAFSPDANTLPVDPPPEPPPEVLPLPAPELVPGPFQKTRLITGR